MYTPVISFSMASSARWGCSGTRGMRQAFPGAMPMSAAQVEQAQLTRPRCSCAGSTAAVHAPPHTPAIIWLRRAPVTVERTRHLNEALHHALVHRLRVDAAAEIEDVREGALLPLGPQWPPPRPRPRPSPPPGQSGCPGVPSGRLLHGELPLWRRSRWGAGSGCSAHGNTGCRRQSWPSCRTRCS